MAINSSVASYVFGGLKRISAGGLLLSLCAGAFLALPVEGRTIGEANGSSIVVSNLDFAACPAGAGCKAETEAFGTGDLISEGRVELSALRLTPLVSRIVSPIRGPQDEVMTPPEPAVEGIRG